MQTYLLFAILVLISVSVGLNLYLLRKVSWVFRLAERIRSGNEHQFRQLFRQLQLLHALERQLALPKSLPPTGGKAGTPDFLKLVADHVLTAKPRLVIECGSGISTIVLARCLQLNGMGHVYSLEHMPEFASATREELSRQGLVEWGTVLDAPLVTHTAPDQTFQWYKSADLPEGSIDLLVVDGPPARTGASPRYPAGPMLFHRLSSNGAIVVDDARRPEERAVIERWRKQFTQFNFQTNLDDFQKGVCVVRRP